MKPSSAHPTLKRLVATQAVRKTSAAARAIPQLVACKNKSNNNNESTKASSRTRLSLQSYTSVETQPHRRKHNSTRHQSTTSNTDYYYTSSFETALDQVLRLELDCPSRTANSHHGSMESCVRDLFKFWKSWTLCLPTVYLCKFHKRQSPSVKHSYDNSFESPMFLASFQRKPKPFSYNFDSHTLPHHACKYTICN